jgi:lysozyme family protein
MTPRFLAACDFALKWETVFAKGHDGDFAFAIAEHDPDDPGGLTKFGIDQRSHQSVDIKALTLEQAKQIYFSSYWLPCGADHMPPGYGEVLFDIKVNGGNGPRMLQQALNKLLPDNEKLTVDGIIGARTLQAMNDEGKAGLLVFLQLRENRYRELAREKPQMAKFLNGWLARNRDLKIFVLSVPA